MEIHIRKSSPKDTAVLMDIWRRSVRATHHFLLETDFLEIESLVENQYLPVVSVLVALNAHSQPVGFMGMSGDHIDALFVDPNFKGQGIGSGLIRHALKDAKEITVDVNEQNEAAVGFYAHFGFQRTGRSELDGQGKPYPLIHLRISAP